jgi:AcrR family transcriptional regulator
MKIEENKVDAAGTNQIPDPTATGMPLRPADAKGNADAPHPDLTKAQIVQFMAQYTNGLDPVEAEKFFNQVRAMTGNGLPPATVTPAAQTIATKEDLDVIFAADETLSEEFKTKATTLFEAALGAALEVEKAKLVEETEKRLDEAVETVKEEITNRVDDYITYVIEQWVKDNTLAIEAGLRTEATDTFMSGLKNLFAEHFVNVPEDKVDVVEALTDEVNDLETKLNEEVAKAIELSKTVRALEQEKIVNEALDGLTDTQKDKARALIETVTTDSTEEYKAKITTIREGVIASTTSKPLNEDKMIDPVEVQETTNTVITDHRVKAAVDALNKWKK